MTSDVRNDAPQPAQSGAPGPMLEELTRADLEREIALYEPLAEAVRELVDATVRTEVDPAVIRDVTEAVRAQTARLRERQLPGAYGVRWTTLGGRRSWGNAVVGRRNPIAPPLRLQVGEDGSVWAELRLGAAYEGPNQLVHGGVAALILDQVLGAAAEVSGSPGMTGTLTMRYVAGTPLGELLRVEARAIETVGVKTIVRGTLSGPEGPCVEAEGVFLLPARVRAYAEEHSRAIGYDPTTYPEL